MSMRMERVASVIKEEIGVLFSREFNNPQYGFITVTEVHMTPDLKIAKVYVSIFGNEEVKQKTLNYLEEQKPHVRQIIGSHVRLKFTPSVQFYLDETMDRVSRIEQLIKQIHEHDNEKPEGK
ncbi:MAG: 30S ribosome-binding factor RbfA [Ignavibacteriae bacterium]|nr:30S ribosome-binding factor RbfA [Ignavibacteriota bacterium]